MKYKGEKHAYLFTKQGIKRANYCGPGTQLKKRLKSGDVPVSHMDEICQRHDIAYADAKSFNDLRVADTKMLKDMDSATNINIVEKKVIGGMMKIKMFGENIKVFGPETFTEIPGLHKDSRTISKKARRKRANLEAYLLDKPNLIG